MTSRWQRRSPEEKQRILDNQENKALAREYKHKPWELPKFKEMSMDLMKKSEIPFWCDDCMNITDSYRYILTRSDLISSLTMIKGRCRTCNKVVQKMMEQPMSTAGMVETMILGNLKRQERLTDKR